MRARRSSIETPARIASRRRAEQCRDQTMDAGPCPQSDERDRQTIPAGTATSDRERRRMWITRQNGLQGEENQPAGRRRTIGRGVEATVQFADLLSELGRRAVHDGARDNLADGQRANRRRRHVQLREPAGQLLGRAGKHDAPQPNPPVRGGAHRAVFAGRVDGGRRALGWREVGRRPSSKFELGMTGLVAGRHPVAVLRQHLSSPGDQDRPERLVAVSEAPRSPTPRNGADAAGRRQSAR